MLALPARPSWRGPHRGAVSPRRPVSLPRRPSLAAERGAPCRTTCRADASSADHPTTPAAPPVRWGPTLSAFAPAALGGLLFGYDIGATSGALASLKSAAAGVAWAGVDAPLSALASGAVVSSSLAGALAGSAAAFAGGEALGRRGELLVAGALYTAAAVAEAGAPSLPALLAARCAYGLAIGAAMHAAPAYIAETASPAVRGLLVSAKEACIVGGILGGYALAYALAAAADGGDSGGLVTSLPAWRVLYGAAAPAGLLLLASAARAPESPRWLALAGRGEDQVRAAVRACRGVVGDGDAAGPAGAAADAEAAAISAAAAAAAAEEAAATSADATVVPTSALALATDARYGRAVRLVLSLMLMQQVTGQPSVLYYATEVFGAAGFGGAGAAGVAAGLGAFKLVATAGAVAAVDRAGRRPLLIGGVGAMTAALAALAAAQAAAGAGPPPSAPGPAQWAAVAALLAYVAAYQVSFGPISWLIVGEALPLAVRGRAAALATLTNFASNFAVSLALPSVQAALGPAGTYAAFAAIAAVSTAVIAATVPETKGKSLEEIEAMMTGPGGR